MANQCEQLLRLLTRDGLQVELVRTNAPYVPPWVGGVPVLRALCRLVPYLFGLWRAAGRAQVMHVFANSGWAWHLFAAPALWIARLRGTAAIVNYRGGLADSFFERAPGHVLRTLRRATLRVTPSPFLQRVFTKHGVVAEVVPNIVDLARFHPVAPRDFGEAPRLLVARNLEPIYDIATAIHAFSRVRAVFPGASLVVAGSGPQREELESLVTNLGLAGCVTFSGRVENAGMPALYAQADCAVNPSTADNMPISLLEAFASGVPVVSTDAGGIPDMLADGESGLLVPVGDVERMAAAVVRVLSDRALAARLRQAGLAEAQRYAWDRVKAQWMDAYRRAAGASGTAA